MGDPRWYQILSLAALNAYGLVALDFETRPGIAAAILASALAAQLAGTRLARLERFDPKSALVSGLGLCMLLRTGSVTIAAVAAALAIGSKFLLRVRGKHVFNPTNFALVALLATTDAAWVSPGQWGSEAFLAFLAACCGFLVIHRAERSDVTIAFVLAWAALLVGRSLWLAEPMAIPLHRLENGTLLIFAFFMISDPKTLPDSRPGRLLFAALVALGAFTVQFVLFRTNGLLWSLAVCATLVPLIDRLLPGERYEWASRAEGRGRGLGFCRVLAQAFGSTYSTIRALEKAAVKGERGSAISPVAPAPRRNRAVPFYGAFSSPESARPAPRSAGAVGVDPKTEPFLTRSLRCAPPLDSR